MQHQEFYSFLRSLEAYENTFDGSDSMMVLDPKSDFFKYFNKK